MNKAIFGAAALMGVCALTASPLLAQPIEQFGSQNHFDDDFDDVFKPWREIEARMPAKPAAEDLVPLYVSAATSYQFHIDRKSISMGTDGVVRYTLIGTSAQGARNVSYEGIRCSKREKKLYAFGRADGSWSRSKRNQWDPIVEADRNRQHAELFTAVCEFDAPVKDADTVIARLKSRPLFLP